MDNYTLVYNELDRLFETKYNRDGRYVKFIYNGYKNNKMTNVSEFSRFILIQSKNQRMTLTDDGEDVKSFLSLSPEEIYELHKDLNELLEKSKKCDNAESSAERMLYILCMSLFSKM